MRRPVRIVRQPRAQSGFEIKMNPGMGFNANQLSWPVMAGEFSAPEIETKRTLQPTDWDQANLEAEKGETVVTDLTQDGIPQHYTIGGKRHYEGGTPLNLPPNSFIFSRDKSMRIKDEEILKMFNMTPTKKGYAPADIAKQYDINKYRKILADPDSEDLQRETAEMMITNYNLKLGKLALVQESLKGFPQGVPMIAMPYIQTMGMNPEEFVQTQGKQDQPEEGTEQEVRYGGRPRNLPKHKFPPGENEISLNTTTPNIWNPTGSPSQGAQIVQNAYGPQNNMTIDPNITMPNVSKIDNSQTPDMGSGSGKITIKRKGLFSNINGPKAAEFGIGALYGAADLFSGDERLAAEADVDRKRVSHKLYSDVGNQDMGNYLKDQYAGQHFRPQWTGQQELDPFATSTMPGQNISKYGGEEGLPKARFGLFGGMGFMGPGSRMVGMRYNPATGGYEAINRRGEVIGFFRGPGQAQGYRDPYSGWDGTGSMPWITSSNAPKGSTDGSQGQETTTTIKKKKVKKQVIPDDAVKEGRVIKRSDYATDAEYEAARDKAFAEAGGKKKVYTQDKDGKYYSVGEKDYSGSSADENLEMIKGAFGNPKVAAELKNNILKAFDQKNSKGKSVIGANTGLTKDEIEKMSPEDLAKVFVEFNTRNIKGIEQLTKDLGIKPGDANEGKILKFFNNATGEKVSNCAVDALGKANSKEDQELCKKITYKSLNDLYEKTGNPLPKDSKSKALQQLTYIGYDNLLKARDNKEIKDDEVNKSLTPFKIGQKGVGDEKIAGKYAGSISDADAVYTNTTAGEYAAITGKKRTEDLLDETEVEEEEKIEEKKKKGITPYTQSGRAPWWLQDIIKTGNAFADYTTLKKYMPFAPTPNLTLPEAVYYDPNRQLAANAEGSANLIQNLAAFQGPQALSSRASGIFGQVAKGAADIMGQYNNMNVGVANNFALQRANLLNQDAVRRTGIAKQLYDENTVANQQFDNAKRQARHNLVNQYTSGITNAMNTYNLNQLYPQYQVHPEWGGPITFEGGRDIEPDISGKDNYMSKFKDYKKQLPAGTSDDVIWNLVKGDISGTASSSVDPEYMKAWQATMQGMNSGNT